MQKATIIISLEITNTQRHTGQFEFQAERQQCVLQIFRFYNMTLSIKMIGRGGSDYRRGDGYPADPATVTITNIHEEEINYVWK